LKYGLQKYPVIAVIQKVQMQTISKLSVLNFFPNNYTDFENYFTRIFKYNNLDSHVALCVAMLFKDIPRQLC
jgi:hypothetical protein